jgi:hypothetical protein
MSTASAGNTVQVSQLLPQGRSSEKKAKYPTAI